MTLYSGDRKDVLSFADICVVFYLLQNVAQTYTVPGAPDKIYAMTTDFTSDDDIFVGCDFIVVGGIGDLVQVFQGEFKPTKDRYVHGGQLLTFETLAVSAKGGISLREII